MQLLKETIATKRTSQRFVLLEGLCNSQKLSVLDDQLELRYMDELFQIEATVGEVAAVIGLQFSSEPEFLSDDQIEYEKFPEPVVEEVKEKAEGVEDEGGEPPDYSRGQRFRGRPRRFQCAKSIHSHLRRCSFWTSQGSWATLLFGQ